MDENNQYEDDLKVQLTVVDENDNPIGTVNKIDAHKAGGPLHRTVSIFLINSEDKMLLQKRSPMKVHAPGVWSNSCCSHPKMGQSFEEAAKETLKREMGIECELKEAFRLFIRTDLGHGHGENELNHIFVGVYNGKEKPNPMDVAESRWIPVEQLIVAIAISPEKYSTVLRMGIAKAAEYKRLNIDPFNDKKNLRVKSKC
ncbi:MAG: isopentenyl-diphosphate Delta-isomerase [Candidatus Micrarchaeales archaeon]